MIKYIIILIAVLNLVSFALYGIDKHKAKTNRWRISEKTLLLWSAAAPFGAVVGTKFFHHKTKKLKFDTVLFMSCIVHTLLYGTLLYMTVK
ncbi:MAG: DUF1294 domain-containing protein [Oscillospiraceae bacterium]|nr:DUF1294 domain-containing protein [Oscillospiraceae bacterium]